MTAILVHGGAGPHRAYRKAKREAVRSAADAGWQVLASGGTALAAVEAATRVLEDDPLFDAGYGSYLNLDGEVEVDAILVDGRDLSFGAVAAVRHVRNPVTLARHVLTLSPHAMLAGEGAERLAREHGLTVPAVDLVAPDVLRGWRERREAGMIPPASSPLTAAENRVWAAGDLGDTVGAVAVDQSGHVAAATSTGGTRDKWPGRVGDSPIMGAGAYADDRCGAVSCTGHGELIMRLCLAFSTCAEMLSGREAHTACDRAMKHLAERTGGEGGLIAVDRAGRLGWARNTAAMPYAWRDDHGAGGGM
jgi:beta-aspartyl-peptidase (threonine type)